MNQHGSGLRIIVYVTAYPRLSETFIQAQVEYLQAQVLCRYVPEGLAPPSSTTVHIIGKDPRLRQGWPLLQQQWRRLTRGRYPGYWLSTAEEQTLHECLQQHQPDVILAQFGSGLIDVSQVAAKLQIPVVVHFHGHDLSRQLRYATYVKTLQRGLGHCAAAVVVNARMLERLRQLSSQTPTHLIPYGYPPLTQPNPALSRRTDARPIVLAVGRLVPKKDPLALVAMALQLAREGVELQLLVVGEGSLRPVVEDAAAELPDTVQVQLLGALPHEQVLELMTRATVFVQLSRTDPSGDEEGWPNTIAEAMAAGLPVVATRTPGIEDQLAAGAGILVEPEDPIAAAKAISALLRDEQQRQSLARAARSRAASYSKQYQALPQLKRLLEAAAAGAKPQSDQPLHGHHRSPVR